MEHLTRKEDLWLVLALARTDLEESRRVLITMGQGPGEEPVPTAEKRERYLADLERVLRLVRAEIKELEESKHG